MTPESLLTELKCTEEFFNRSTSVLTEENSTFAPAEGLLTSAQSVAHVAQTVDWFMEGAFRPEGFNMEFEAMGAELMKVTSLKDAREWVERAFHNAREIIGSKTAEELTTALPAGPIMGGAPRFAIVSGIDDHTAHHRGALTVYSRLCGHTPLMPYGEM